MESLQSIRDFISQKNIALVGISQIKQKFGNAIYKELKKKGYNVFPVHRTLSSYENTKCYKDIESLPDDVSAIVLNTKSENTLLLLNEAKQKGIQWIWIQQGAENKEIIEKIKSDQQIIFGKCILMFLAPLSFPHNLHRFISKLFGKYPV